MINQVRKFLDRFLKKPLKIGMITYNYPIDKAVIAGPSVNTRNLARNLAALGCEVHVFCSGNKDKLIKERIEGGKLIIHVLSVFTGFESNNLALSERLKWYTFETRVMNQIMWENSKRWFDIIHTQGWPSTGFMLKHFSKMNWVHTFRSLSKVRFKLQKKETKYVPVHDWVEKTVLDADKIICVSGRFREEVIRNIKGIAKKTVFIYNGIDLKIFNSSRASPPAVLFVGRFCKAKGVEFIPEIVNKILKKNSKYKFYMVANKDTGSAELELLTKQLLDLEKEYKGRFIWYKEPLTHEELAEVHKKAGVYVQLSLYEPFGNTVLEAMATGKSVVVTDVGGMPEMIGKAGLVAKLNSADISRKLLKFLANSSLRKKYKKLALERAKAFEWKIIAQQNLDLYNEVINERKKREFEQVLKNIKKS